MKYQCPKCGKVHTELPAITFDTPYHYHVLSAADKDDIAQINSDFCVIHHEEEDRVDRFIRVVMIQKIIDHCEDLEYGVWVSLSEESFRDYRANFDLEDHEVSYFAWFCNQIPEYENTLGIRTNVHTQKGDNRPRIEIQSDENMDHPFVRDYFEGISLKEAKRRLAKLFS